MRPEVSAVILAAGMSRRMGSCKPLLKLGGRPLVLRCIDAITVAGVKDIVVVLGACTGDVADVICDMPVGIAVNPDPEGDMASSVREGVKGVSRACTGVLVCLVDHPLVSPDTYRTLVLRHSWEPGAIHIPVHEGKRGHPTLFPLPLLRGMTSDQTLRDLIDKNPWLVRLAEVPDKGVTVDIDTPEDYEGAEKLVS